MNILTVTPNPTIDKSSTIDQVIPERKLRCHSLRRDPGGGGINVSRAVKKLGGESLALFPAGGLNGQLLQELLKKEEIEQCPVSIEGLTRENLTIYEESSGQQFRFGMPGPTLNDEEWQQCLDEISRIEPKPEYIVASGSLPPGFPDDFYGRVASLAKKRAIRVILDTTGDPLQHAMEQGVFIVKPNMRELKQLTGKPVQGESEMREIAEEVVSSGQTDVVVVSLGAGGAFMVSANERRHLRAPTVPIKSKVGAGDSMVAGIVLRLVRGGSLQESVQFGVAVGAAAVMTPGTELCRREDAEALYRIMNSN